MLIVPTVSFGSTVDSIINNISVRSNSGGVHTSAVAGADGQSVSSSARGADGADGADGTVINGNNSSHVDVYTEINGKVIEDVHTDAPYEQTHVYEDGGTRVETYINTHASSATERVVKQVHTTIASSTPHASIVKKEVASITSQYISEGTDMPVTAVEVSEPEEHASPTPMHNAVEQLHRILSGIFTYVSNIFA